MIGLTKKDEFTALVEWLNLRKDKYVEVGCSIKDKSLKYYYLGREQEVNEIIDAMTEHINFLTDIE